MRAAEAESVVAVELDPHAVAHSRKSYPLDNLEFMEGSMLDLDNYPSSSFDLVVCFRGNEHVQEQEELHRRDRPSPQAGRPGRPFNAGPGRLQRVIHDPNPFTYAS